MSDKPEVHVVGGGLAGSEAAWQCLKSGLAVVLHEMRPEQMTEAHQTGHLAELVCSNSMKSENPDSAPGLLKHDMQRFESLILQAAYKFRVPAGQALAIDREKFSQEVETQLQSFTQFKRVAEVVKDIPSQQELEAKNQLWIVATGPLTGKELGESILRRLGSEKFLAFYDAISPIIATESINMEKAYRGSRYGEVGEGDYINLPMNKDEYEAFIDACLAAEKTPLHEFEKTPYFEGCLPIEVMIDRGRETLRFGPMKPVGLRDPRTGHRPWAVVQLRMENLIGTMHSMVGFQTKMKWGEQARVFRMIPALENAEFLRFGSIHRNTYFESPKILQHDLSIRHWQNVFLAGQITGVEGYLESASIGLMAGRSAVQRACGAAFVPPPRDTMLGALLNYVTYGGLGQFQPMNSNMGLLPAEQKIKGQSKDERKAIQCGKARDKFAEYARAF